MSSAMREDKAALVQLWKCVRVTAVLTEAGLYLAIGRRWREPARRQ